MNCYLISANTDGKYIITISNKRIFFSEDYNNQLYLKIFDIPTDSSYTKSIIVDSYVLKVYIVSIYTKKYSLSQKEIITLPSLKIIRLYYPCFYKNYFC